MRYKKGRLLSSEDLKKMNGQKVLAPYLNRNGEYKTYIVHINESEEKGNYLEYGTNDDLWNIDGTYIPEGSLKIYEYIEEDSQPKQYNGGEIVSMIITGELKEGQELTGVYDDTDKYPSEFIIEKDNNDNELYLKEVLSDSYTKTIDFCVLTHINFTIKEKEYFTFDEARRTNTTRVRNENMNNGSWMKVTEALEYLSGLELSLDEINKIMDEKAWEIEEVKVESI